MQFNRNLGAENFTTAVHREMDENTLVIEIKQKTTTASELNEVVKKFAADNHIDELDSNSMQLITEELVVMVLLQTLSPGMSLQYFITCNRDKGAVTLAMGYPGVSYNPFETEDNIFMINIFREWITEIEFSNPDNKFNELILTINVTQTGSELDDLIDMEPVEDPVCADSNSEFVSVFDPESGKRLRDAVPAGEVVQYTRVDDVHVLELLIRQKGITSDELYNRIDVFFASLNFEAKRIMFDDRPTIAQASAKSVCKVMVFDILEHYNNHVRNMEFSLRYCKGTKELTMRLWYEGGEYNPFIHNKDSRGIKVLHRQKSVTSFYAYNNEANVIMSVMEVIG